MLIALGNEQLYHWKENTRYEKLMYFNSFCLFQPQTCAHYTVDELIPLTAPFLILQCLQL